MELTPEERRRIYEEERERIENEKQQKSAETPTLKLPDKCCLDFVLCAVLDQRYYFVVLKSRIKPSIFTPSSLSCLRQPDHIKPLFELDSSCGRYFQRPHRFIGFCFLDSADG